MPLSCSLLQQIKSQQPSGAWRASQEQLQTEANWGIAMDFRARQPEHASIIIRIRVEVVLGLHAKLLLS